MATENDNTEIHAIFEQLWELCDCYDQLHDFEHPDTECSPIFLALNRSFRSSLDQAASLGLLP